MIKKVCTAVSCAIIAVVSLITLGVLVWVALL